MVYVDSWFMRNLWFEFLDDFKTWTHGFWYNNYLQCKLIEIISNRWTYGFDSRNPKHGPMVYVDPWFLIPYFFQRKTVEITFNRWTYGLRGPMVSDIIIIFSEKKLLKLHPRDGPTVSLLGIQNVDLWFTWTHGFWYYIYFQRKTVEITFKRWTHGFASRNPKRGPIVYVAHGFWYHRFKLRFCIL